MRTGEYGYTAIAVAKDVGMADATKPILLMEAGRAEPEQPQPSTHSTAHADPDSSAQHSALHSALYASTGPSASVSQHAAEEDSKGGEVSLEESAAIHHVLSIPLDALLYCTRRHVTFAAPAATPNAVSPTLSPATAAHAVDELTAEDPQQTLIDLSHLEASLGAVPLHPSIQQASDRHVSLHPKDVHSSRRHSSHEAQPVRRRLKLTDIAT